MRRGIQIGALIVWLAGVLAGAGWLSGFAYRHGDEGAIAARWPEASALSRASGKRTLVMALHPQCPCSRASVEELSRILTVSRAGETSAVVMIVVPRGAPASWRTSPLIEDVRRIPGVNVVIDDGAEAQRFGALTSGQVSVFDADGRLAFHGGITSARGHVGDNAGQAAVQAVMLGDAPTIGSAPVYGCPLEDGAKR